MHDKTAQNREPRAVFIFYISDVIFSIYMFFISDGQDVLCLLCHFTKLVLYDSVATF